MTEVCLWGTWDLPVLTPHFAGLSQPLGIFHQGQEPSLTDWWLGTSGMISNTACYWVTSLMVSGDHPLWRCSPYSLQLFIDLHLKPLQGGLIIHSQCMGLPRAAAATPQSTQIKSWLLSISSPSPKPADYSRCRLHCIWNTERFKTCFQLASV